MDTKTAGLDSEYHLQQSEIMNATQDFRDGAFAFVTDGTVAVRELGHYGVSAPIPRGECAISALIAGKSRKKIYGTTAGRKAHLFYYDPSPVAEHVVDIGVLGENVVCRHLFLNCDGSLYGIVDPSGDVFRYDPEGEYSLLWTYRVNKIEWLGVSLKAEIGASVMNQASGEIVAITKEDSKLLVFSPSTKDVRTLGTVEQAGNCNAVVIDNQGFLYGSCKNSHIFRSSISDGKTEVFEQQIPAPRGLEYLNFVDSLLFDGCRTIYGGTTLGCLFRLDTITLELTHCGRVVTDHRIRSIVMGNDGILYGCAGSPKKNSHLFRWDPHKGEVKDLGLLMVHFPRNWICYEISCLAVGGNGEVYVGESETVSYLFIYYPPVRQRHS